MIPLYLLGKTQEKNVKDSLLRKYLGIFLVVASYWYTVAFLDGLMAC